MILSKYKYDPESLAFDIYNAFYDHFYTKRERQTFKQYLLNFDIDKFVFQNDLTNAYLNAVLAELADLFWYNDKYFWLFKSLKYDREKFKFILLNIVRSNFKRLVNSL